MKRSGSTDILTMPEVEAKKKDDGASILIGTHDGTFHCDEVLACWMLKQLPQYKTAKIIRTRDLPKLNTCHTVVDVGGVYDCGKNRFDHHQRGFTGTMKSLGNGKWDTKLSSAGLVYLHKGKNVLSQLTKLDIGDPNLDKLYNKVYEKFVEEIDGIDNGVDQYSGGEPKYQVTTNLSSRVSGLNPSWNEKGVDIEDRFNTAMTICGLEFMDRVKYYNDSWLPARTIVEQVIEARHKVDASGEIIVFKESGGCPWKEHLFDIETLNNIQPTIKFVLYQDQNDNWRVQCVPKTLGSFENRLSLLEQWRGLRDNQLSTTSGIPGCIFVHAGGFIGGNKTYDGALEMAKKTLQSRITNEE